MTYSPNIPQSGDDPAQSQPLILGNFATINNDFSQNHIPLTSGGNPGQHTQLFFPVPLAADPDLPAPQSSIYPKAVAGVTQMFFQNDTGPTHVTQLTGLTVSNVGSLYGFLTPWGMIFNTGTAPAAPGGGSVTFQYAFPLGFTLLTAQLTAKSIVAPNTVLITGVTTTQLNYKSSADCYFLVIGK